MGMGKKARRALAVSIAAIASSVMQTADAGTLVTHDWANGYLPFTVDSPVGDNEHVWVGGFTGTFEGDFIQFWCAQLNQYFTPGNTYTGYTPYNAPTDPPDFQGVLPFPYSTLGRLFTEVGNVSPPSSTANSAAFQLAVWEIIYEPFANGYHLNTGAFTATGDGSGPDNAALTTAQGWLDNLPALSTYNVTFLYSRDNQDFVYAKPGISRQEIPEPSPLPLVGIGLAVMLFVMSRRRGERGIAS